MARRHTHTKTSRAMNASNHGVTVREMFDLEVRCLRRLERRFKCQCRRKRQHFPKIVNVNPTTFSITTADCGVSVRKIHNRRLHRPPRDSREQFACIRKNLDRAGVWHLDMVSNGKNVCIDRHGTISVIDFDLAVVDKKPISEAMGRRVNRFWNNFDERLRQAVRRGQAAWSSSSGSGS